MQKWQTLFTLFTLFDFILHIIFGNVASATDGNGASELLQSIYLSISDLLISLMNFVGEDSRRSGTQDFAFNLRAILGDELW